MIRISLLFLSALFLGGCVSKPPPITATREQQLTHMIRRLDRSVDPTEARRLAHEALVYSRTLAQQYAVVGAPWIQNFLVNIGIKKRGLCYQWADDLYRDLQHLRLRSLAVYPVGAYIGSYWREHNALVVLPVRHTVPLAQGIVLDPWRHAGALFFATIAHDPAYPWTLRPERIPVSCAEPHLLLRAHDKV